MAAEGMRQRGKPQSHNFQSTSDLRDDDDEMLDFENTAALKRSSSESNVNHGHEEVSVLYRFVNQYVLRYCLRIRDALRSMITGRQVSASASVEAIPPSSQTRAALELLDTIQKTPFNVDVEEHTESLRELWALLGDGREYARVGAHWSLIGFQGKDPATDFRGQGALGLRNMVYFARNHTDFAKHMIAAQNNTLPFAISVINISAHLLILLNSNAGRLGNALFEFVQSSGEALSLFDNLFGLVFVEFVNFHRQAIAAFISSGGNPALAVMQFNPIRAKFFDTLSTQVSDGSFMTNYVERCSSAIGVVGDAQELPFALPFPGPHAASSSLLSSSAPAHNDAVAPTVPPSHAQPKVGMLVDLS